MKKLLSIALTFVLLFSSVSMIAVNAVAYGEKTAEGFYYTVVENKYASIIGVQEGYFRDVIEIPSEIEGYTVKYIDYIGYGAEYIKEIIIPETVTYIGEDAFAFDSGDDYEDITSDIETIVLPSNLTYIGEDAFKYNTKLKEINIPETVSYIGAKAFANCDSLKEVYIPGTVRVMGHSVFASCDGLEKVTIGKGMETIPKLTFESCKALKNVNLPDSVYRILKYAFYNCKNLNSLAVTDRVISFGDKAVGFYINKKGKEVQKKNFKLKVYETMSRRLDNHPLFCANLYGFESVFYLDAKAHYIMYCELYSGSRIKNIKTKLKIKGVEVEKWTSSKPNVVKITPNGKLKTTGKGTTTLTAKLKDGSTYKRKLKVKM